MKRITLLLLAVASLAGVVAFTAFASRHADQEAAPVFVKTNPPGYRDRRLISVAREEGNLNDIRAILLQEPPRKFVLRKPAFCFSRRRAGAAVPGLRG
jgi:hypothetical protein